MNFHKIQRHMSKQVGWCMDQRIENTVLKTRIPLLYPPAVAFLFLYSY
uniref:Uncharacterized protein n=1 Tax=Rhizophora mucronata TaxID=61149 RepID=A0A2P2PN78_RHIMU